jgi:hypothetical protein
MHSSYELRSDSFAVEIEGRAASLSDLFPGFGEQDRLGVVVRAPCGASGRVRSSAPTVTAFYDFQRARGPDFFVYPEYYLLHAGGPHGDHALLDVFPRRKEPVVADEPKALLEALNERAITRLVVEDGSPASLSSTAPSWRARTGGSRVASPTRPRAACRMPTFGSRATR